MGISRGASCFCAFVGGAALLHVHGRCAEFFYWDTSDIGRAALVLVFQAEEGKGDLRLPGFVISKIGSLSFSRISPLSSVWPSRRRAHSRGLMYSTNNLFSFR